LTRAEPPATTDLRRLGAAARRCTACPLYARATQTVWGSGPGRAEIVLVGEQPGDEEDRAGQPFVGPAGRLLDRALADAGIPREHCWVTNAVKHFKWVARGKRRIHERPTSREVAACRPWLEAELAAIAPRALVCLGATATGSLLGSAVRVTRDRGTVARSRWAEHTTVTIHPSAVLRARDEESRRAEYTRLVADLRGLAKTLAAKPSGASANGPSSAAELSRPSVAPRTGRSRSPASGSSRSSRSARS
jgi:DNA polymerase